MSDDSTSTAPVLPDPGDLTAITARLDEGDFDLTVLARCEDVVDDVPLEPENVHFLGGYRVTKVYPNGDMLAERGGLSVILRGFGGHFEVNEAAEADQPDVNYVPNAALPASAGVGSWVAVHKPLARSTTHRWVIH